MNPSKELTKEQQIEHLTATHQKALTALMAAITKESKIQREKNAAIQACSIVEEELRSLKADILSPIA